jgi:hypothetical protein
MDWFSGWDPVPNLVSFEEIERLDPPADGGPLAAWLLLAVTALVFTVMWYWPRVVRHSFWCPVVGRDVEVHLGRGCVRGCSAFEDRTAIACARRCLNPSFRAQWPWALPVSAAPRGTVRLG